MALRIYNSQTQKKELFEPLVPGKLKMYVCGITSYAPSHIGHARCYVSFDVIVRWLRRSYDVCYVRNFTDVDDKIIRAAWSLKEDFSDISTRYIQKFGEDMARLGCDPPDVEPKATEHMVEMISLIQSLEELGVAYSVEGNVFFEVAKYAKYGGLSNRTLDELEAGARVEIDKRKRSPFDFALWKPAKPGEPFWESPWGKGRPGWHIECSAMSMKYLGETFDIHGGGKDLLFPHHENEIAQSCASSGKEHLARFWMHNGFVNVAPEKCPSCQHSLAPTDDVQPLSEQIESCAQCGYKLTEEDLKMSKSRGNFYPIFEILSRYEPEALRFFLLSSHYRHPIQFSHEVLEESEKRLDKIYETIAKIDEFTRDQTFISGKSFKELFRLDPQANFQDAMDDDFNTAKALGDMSEVFKIANDLIHGSEKERLGQMLSPADTSRILVEIRECIRSFGDVLGLWIDNPPAYLGRRKMSKAKTLAFSAAEIAQLVDERTLARSSRDFKRGDEIRDLLKSKGIVLRDSPQGTTWDIEDG